MFLKKNFFNFDPNDFFILIFFPKNSEKKTKRKTISSMK